MDTHTRAFVGTQCHCICTSSFHCTYQLRHRHILRHDVHVGHKSGLFLDVSYTPSNQKHRNYFRKFMFLSQCIYLNARKCFFTWFRHGTENLTRPTALIPGETPCNKAFVQNAFRNFVHRSVLLELDLYQNFHPSLIYSICMTACPPRRFPDVSQMVSRYIPDARDN